jgi:UDP-N-acetylmuramyl pentapeptide phosphotransferase/UDP-N-acetylglucosamine-1-phosphate transferase
MFPEGFYSAATNPYVLTALAAVLAYWVSVHLYPVIIYLSQAKNLMEEPGERSAHQYRVPTYGGAGIFIAFSVLAMSLSCLGNCPQEALARILSLMAGISILFFLGIKDDMVGLDPAKKFAGQLVAAALAIFVGGVRIESLDGIFGLGELPYLASVLFTTFVFLLVVNAYNLIDGIDGLAGSQALIATIVFGGFFLVAGDTPMAITSFVLVGALLGFLRFNLSYSKRLFMGDSGSLFVGFLLAFQAVVFLGANQASAPGSILSNAPVIVLAVLAFPLLDTLRVFIVRVRQGRSPFSADRNHLHHHLLARGLDHKQATGLIALKTLLLVTVCWTLQDIEIHTHLGCTVVLGLALFLGPLTIKPREVKTPDTAYGDAQRKTDAHEPPVVRAAHQAKKRGKSLRETATTGD